MKTWGEAGISFLYSISASHTHVTFALSRLCSLLTEYPYGDYYPTLTLCYPRCPPLSDCPSRCSPTPAYNLLFTIGAVESRSHSATIFRRLLSRTPPPARKTQREMRSSQVFGSTHIHLRIELQGRKVCRAYKLGWYGYL